MKRFLPAFLFAWLSFLAGAACAQTTDYTVRKVAYQDLVANLYLPKVSGKVPVVIAIGGSEGGLGTGDANGKMLAPYGIAVLGLAYFKEQGLPATLDQIPVEYFVRAIDYLDSVPEVDPKRLGFVGGSRGAELALLLASIEPRIRSLVATTPSKLAWYGRTRNTSAWTYRGADWPALALGLDDKSPQLERFKAALDQPELVGPALFAVENINGPLLLVSAENDQVWPSFQMSRDIVAQLKQRRFPYSVRHDSYPTGHGFSQELAPAIRQTIIDHFVRTLKP
jgi:dienelactone hydrolase